MCVTVLSSLLPLLHPKSLREMYVSRSSHNITPARLLLLLLPPSKADVTERMDLERRRFPPTESSEGNPAGFGASYGTDLDAAALSAASRPDMVLLCEVGRLVAAVCMHIGPEATEEDVLPQVASRE